jgi:hypothetical protein
MPPSVPVSSTADLSHADNAVTPKKNNLSHNGRTKVSKRLLKKSRSQTARPPKAFADSNTSNPSQEESNPLESSAASLNSNNLSSSLYNSANMMPYGMSPYYGGMSPMMTGGGPFNSLNQFLYGIQTVVFSLSQAVQLLGMNQQVLQQAFDSLSSMMDHAISTFHELRALEAMDHASETEEQRHRRKRLKTIRWCLMAAGSYIVYKLIRRITSKKRKQISAGPNTNVGSTSALGYGGPSSMMYGNSSYRPSMYGGGYSSNGPSMYGGVYGSGGAGFF